MTRKTTLSHLLPNALTDTRTTHAAYTHVVVGRWSQRDLDHAIRHRRRARRAGQAGRAGRNAFPR